jgi:flagellum-specific peptidoglycan hydrolase FlgJ
MKIYNFILTFLIGFASGISIVFTKNNPYTSCNVIDGNNIIKSESTTTAVYTTSDVEIINTLDNVAINLIDNIKQNDEIHALVISRYYKLALSEQKRYGFPASVKLAQMLVEGGYSKTYPKGSKLVQDANNPFGIKYFGDGVPIRVQKWNELVYSGQWVSATDDCNHQKCRFVKFRGIWHAFRFHSEFMTGVDGYPSHYKSHITTGDWKDWVIAIEKGKYATDTQYNTKLTNIIEQYKLYMFDDFAMAV